MANIEKIENEIFNKKTKYTNRNLQTILKDRFNVQEIKLEDLEIHIEEYEMFAKYYNKIEDYTEERIKTGDNFIVFITDDDDKKLIYE